MAGFRIDPQEFVQRAAARGTTRTDATKNWETALGLGSSAMHVANPILANNPRQQSLRSSYVSAYDAYNKISPAVNAFSRYEQASELLHPDTGGDAASEVVSLENLTQNTADILSWTNPALGVTTWLNSLTEDDKNPYGKIPILKDLEKGKDWVAAKLDETGFGQALREKSKAAWDLTIGKVMDTEAGRAIYEGSTDALTAVDKYLLMGLAPGLHDAKEGLAYKGYLGLDRAAHGYLPGGITPTEYKIEKHGMAEDEWARDFLRQGIAGEPGGGSMDKLWEMQTIWSNRNPPDRSTNPLADEVWSDDSPGAADIYHPEDVAKLYVDAGGDVSDAIDFTEKHYDYPDAIIVDYFDPLYTAETRFEAYSNGEISDAGWVEKAWAEGATFKEFDEMRASGVDDAVIWKGGISAGLSGEEVGSRAGIMAEPFTPQMGSAEWFADTPMEMITVKLNYGEVATPHMVKADGTKMPIQAMPEFWDWLDVKRAALGDGGFRSYIASLYGVDSWTKTPHFRFTNWGNPSEYLRKYNGHMEYASHIHRWLPAVQAFYNEMVSGGNEAIDARKGVNSGVDAGRQVADISATIDRGAAQQTLMNALGDQPSWRFEQSTGPSTGGNTLPSFNVTAIQN